MAGAQIRIELVIAQHVHREVDLRLDGVQVGVEGLLVDGERGDAHRQHPLDAPYEDLNMMRRLRQRFELSGGGIDIVLTDELARITGKLICLRRVDEWHPSLESFNETNERGVVNHFVWSV